HPSDDSLRLEIFAEQPQVHVHEIDRHRVERRLIGAVTRAAAPQLRLVVAREEARARARRDAVGHELRLEKAACRLWLAERNDAGRWAALAPRARRARVVDAAEGGIVGFGREHGAGTHECLNGVLWVALRPRPELAELDRVESKRRWRDRRGRRGLGGNDR